MMTVIDRQMKLITNSNNLIIKINDKNYKLSLENQLSLVLLECLNKGCYNELLIEWINSEGLQAEFNNNNLIINYKSNGYNVINNPNYIPIQDDYKRYLLRPSITQLNQDLRNNLELESNILLLSNKLLLSNDIQSSRLSNYTINQQNNYSNEINIQSKNNLIDNQLFKLLSNDHQSQPSFNRINFIQQFKQFKQNK